MGTVHAMKTVRTLVSAGLVCALAFSCPALLSCSGGEEAAEEGAGSERAADEGNEGEEEASYGLVEEGTVTVATTPFLAPMEYGEGDGYDGFDVALMTEVADRLGLGVVFDDEPRDSILETLAEGSTYDCAISALRVQDDAPEGLVYTDGYLDAGLSVVVAEKSSAASVDDLDGLSVAAIRDSEGEEWVEENIDYGDYTPFQDSTDLLDALEEGTIDAAVVDTAVADWCVDGDYEDLEVLDQVGEAAEYAIAVNAEKQALADAIGEALAEMEEDGTIEELEGEYLEAEDE